MRIAGPADAGLERLKVQRPGQAIVFRDGDPEVTGEDLAVSSARIWAR